MRGFMAIEAGSEVSIQLAGLVGELKRKTATGASYPKVFHITLKFLGEFEESKLLEKIKVAMATACAGAEKFTLEVRGIGCFPSPERPRVVFASAGDGRLEALAGRVEEEMAKLGFERENRKFAGHITLARLKGPAVLDDFLEKYRNAYFGSIAVERVALKKSVLGPAGPVYEDVHSVELK